MKFSTLLCLVLPISAHGAFLPPELQLRLLGEDLGWLEGPAWSDREQALYFSRQTDSGAIYRWTADGGVETFRSFSFKVNGNAIDREGRLINCESSAAASKETRRLVRYETDGSKTVLVDNLDGQTLNQPNDVIVDSQGRLWFTTPSWSPGEQNRQFILRHDPASGETVNLALRDKCNGLGLSPDERTLYVVVWGDPFSTANNKVVKYAVDGDGNLGPAQDFITGLTYGADGMTVDRWGNLFVVVAAGPKKGVQVYSPTGEHLGEIPVPDVPRDLTNCTFGGTNGAVLFITAGPNLYSLDLSDLYYFGEFPKNDPVNVDTGELLGWLYLIEGSDWVYAWKVTTFLYLPEHYITPEGLWTWAAR